MRRRLIRAAIATSCVSALGCRLLSADHRTEARAVLAATVSEHRRLTTSDAPIVVDARVLQPSDRSLAVPDAPAIWTQTDFGSADPRLSIADSTRVARCPATLPTCLGDVGAVVLLLSYPVVRGDSAYVEIHTERVTGPAEEGELLPLHFERALWVMGRNGTTWKLVRRRVYTAA